MLTMCLSKMSSYLILSTASGRYLKTILSFGITFKVGYKSWISIGLPSSSIIFTVLII